MDVLVPIGKSILGPCTLESECLDDICVEVDEFECSVNFTPLLG